MKRAIALLAAIALAGFSPPAPTPASDAEQAVAAFHARFWAGSPAGGHYAIINNNVLSQTVHGPSQETPSNFAWTWQYAQAWNVDYTYWKLVGSTDSLARLTAEWAWTKAIWTPNQIAVCGNVGGQSYTSMDDSTWGAMGFVELFDATGDAQALSYSAATIDCAYERWFDATTGGGLEYQDSGCTSSICKESFNTEFALAMIECYQRGCSSTHLTNAQMLADGRAIMDWANAHLIRTAGTVCPQVDSLYWIGVYSNAGVVTPTENACNNPTVITEGSSVTQLSNNMAGAAANARLYALTGQASYLAFAKATAASVAALETDAHGAWVDDRDARTNGYAAWNFVNDVAPVLAAPAPVIAAFRATERCIMATARAPDNSFAGDWCGGSVWTNGGFVSDQLEVSANAVMMVIGNLAFSTH